MLQVLWPQLPDWGCHHGSVQRHGGCSHQDSGEMEEFGVLGVHQDPKTATGQLLLFVKLTCVVHVGLQCISAIVISFDLFLPSFWAGAWV